LLNQRIGNDRNGFMKVTASVIQCDNGFDLDQQLRHFLFHLSPLTFVAQGHVDLSSPKAALQAA
jgi:hypothetical protein